MVKVSVKFKKDVIVGIDVYDHANSGDYGQDLVCAGVSSICFGILNALDELCKDACVLEVKDAYVSVALKDETCAKAQTILYTMYIQLQVMEHSYDKFIKITKAEV